MNRTLSLIVGVFVLTIMALPLVSSSQVKNEAMANAILAARTKNAALMKQYNWNSRTDMMKDGKLQDLRIDLVNIGPTGQPVRSLLNDQQGALPGGLFRHAIAEKQRKEFEGYVGKMHQLIDQYTLNSPGKVIDFISQAQIQPITANGKSLVQVSGNNVLVPGDSFTLTLDGPTLNPASVTVTSTNTAGDLFTISATFATNAAKLNYLQYATVEVASKGITILVHNYDYVPQ